MKKVFNHKLFKVFGLNSLAVFAKMGAMFFWVKLQALFIGVEGFALIGDFKNFTTSTKTISTLGFDSGVVSLVSKNKGDLEALSKIISTSFFSRLFFSGLISLVLILFSTTISSFIISSNEIFESVVILLAIFVPFYSINSLLLAVLNGLGAFKRLIIVNIIATLVGFVISVSLLYWYHLKGVLISFAVVESLVVGITFFFLKKFNFKLSYRFLEADILKKLLSFSAMTLISAIVVPFSTIYIRNLIRGELGVDEVGYWETLNRLSGYYMFVITSTIGMYYLPKIASITNDIDLQKEFKGYLKFFGLSFLMIIVGVYSLRYFIIDLILSRDFYPVADLILFQLLGDYVKIFILFFGYKMIADRDLKKYIALELFFYALYIALSYYFLKVYQDVKYVVLSYFLSYVGAVFLVVIFYGKNFFSKKV
ncbi:O-antigen translocase [Wenyingzhuangia sp. IMCC45574]